MTATNRIGLTALLLLGVFGLMGCRTAPPPPPAPAERQSAEPPPVLKPVPNFHGASIPFREVIASVPVEGAHQVYQNLHVGLTAIFSPRHLGEGDALEVKAMAARLEPRVAFEVLRTLTDSPTMSPHKLDQVRDNVAAKIQPVVGKALEGWPQASQYDVEVVIVSMYWTDSSVGRKEAGEKNEGD